MWEGKIIIYFYYGEIKQVTTTYCEKIADFITETTVAKLASSYPSKIFSIELGCQVQKKKMRDNGRIQKDSLSLVSPESPPWLGLRDHENFQNWHL